MWLQFAYRFALWLLSLVVHRGDLDDQIELLALRHQVKVLSRQKPRPRLSWCDRALLSMLFRTVSAARWSSFIFRPETLMGWHRVLVCKKWTYPSRRGGRPEISQETCELNVRLANENSRWGKRRIQGECKRLGVIVSYTAIMRVLRHAGIGPAPRRGQTWAEFLKAQASTIVSCDFFSIETVGLQTLYVLFFIEHGTRRVHIAGITRHPNAAWVTQVARNLTDGFDGVLNDCRFLIRDRDAKFTTAFDVVFCAIGARIINTPVRSPKANAIAERFIGTARRECLDHLLILNERHAGYVIEQFVKHYNGERSHYGLDLDSPIQNNVVPLDAGRKLRCKQRLGGLLRTYDTVAA